MSRATSESTINGGIGCKVLRMLYCRCLFVCKDNELFFISKGRLYSIQRISPLPDGDGRKWMRSICRRLKVGYALIDSYADLYCHLSRTCMLRHLDKAVRPRSFAKIKITPLYIGRKILRTVCYCLVACLRSFSRLPNHVMRCHVTPHN